MPDNLLLPISSPGKAGYLGGSGKTILETLVQGLKRKRFQYYHKNSGGEMYEYYTFAKS